MKITVFFLLIVAGVQTAFCMDDSLKIVQDGSGRLLEEVSDNSAKVVDLVEKKKTKKKGKKAAEPDLEAAADDSDDDFVEREEAVQSNKLKAWLSLQSTICGRKIDNTKLFEFPITGLAIASTCMVNYLYPNTTIATVLSMFVGASSKSIALDVGYKKQLLFSALTCAAGFCFDKYVAYISAGAMTVGMALKINLKEYRKMLKSVKAYKKQKAKKIALQEGVVEAV